MLNLHMTKPAGFHWHTADPAPDSAGTLGKDPAHKIYKKERHLRVHCTCRLYTFTYNSIRAPAKLDRGNGRDQPERDLTHLAFDGTTF
jgi:hypothetical protein